MLPHLCSWLKKKVQCVWARTYEKKLAGGLNTATTYFLPELPFAARDPARGVGTGHRSRGGRGPGSRTRSVTSPSGRDRDC